MKGDTSNDGLGAKKWFVSPRMGKPIEPFGSFALYLDFFKAWRQVMILIPKMIAIRTHILVMNLIKSYGG